MEENVIGEVQKILRGHIQLLACVKRKFARPRLALIPCRPSSARLASIPAPLTRGPGNHRLHVGGFNTKFVSKTLFNLSINLLHYGHSRG